MPTDITKAVTVLSDRRDLYDNAETYYRGSETEVFSAAKWGKFLRSSSRINYVLNYSKTVVDTVLDRLEIASIEGTTEAANKKLNEIWEQNELILDQTEIHRRALVFGECYAIVWPDETGEVQITYNPPTTTVMIYDDENPRIKSFAAKLWQTTNAFDKKMTRMNLYYADRVEKYSRLGELTLITQAEKTWNLVEVVDNPFGEVPVFHFRTHRPYGSPEHSSAIGPQDAINKIVINHMETIDYHGAPQRYALSMGAGGEVADFEEGDRAAENMNALRNGPGELWYLNGVAAVGQFQPADHKTFTEPIMSYVKSMASLTQTPLHYFQNNGQFASGEALRTAEAPLIKKVKERQLSFGSTWRDIFRFALKIEGISVDVQVRWQSAESIDSSDAWEIAQMKRGVGIPLVNVLMEMGYDKELAEEIAAEAEKEWEERGMNNSQAVSQGMNSHNTALKNLAEQTNRVDAQEEVE